jgi:hypothetical protein
MRQTPYMLYPDRCQWLSSLSQRCSLCLINTFSVVVPFLAATQQFTLVGIYATIDSGIKPFLGKAVPRIN